MTEPTILLNKALSLIATHLEALKTKAETPTKDGSLKGLDSTDSQVIDRYTKILITLTKKDAGDGMDTLSDAELLEIANGHDNVPTEMGDTE